MWRFKPFLPKEPAGLEGRTIDVGNLKIHVRNAIAEGGFSCVYLVRDVLHASKQYALKHMICNDSESLELVMKEISVMKSLKGHPNIVQFHAHTILDMGRTKEALLVMEFCDKSLVSVLESRGAGYFEEKQVLSVFRDVCNAVFAMHSQSPPIAHRDLKAENLLLGSDGLWKLCDFGSTTTNHKRFEKPGEMGIEEDNIRKHTTPAYRAPEMWDLFRRELINEKVDIWALGCLLFRLCYFKSAFDGESKLQVLNGNYRIPELPKYSTVVTDLIRDMLQASPDDRPDITQVWFRVNEQLPENLHKSLPDGPPESQLASTHESGTSKHSNKSSPVPRRSSPPIPSSGPSQASASSGPWGQLGAFWSTEHANDVSAAENKSRLKFDEEPTACSTQKIDRSRSGSAALPKSISPAKKENTQTRPVQRDMHGKLLKVEDSHKDFELTFFEKDAERSFERPSPSKPESTSTFENAAFNTFVTEFDTNKFRSGSSINDDSGKEEALEAEIEKLKEQLRLANKEKVEITSKYEKLSAICRSQRQEIQELKQTVAARTPTPNKNAMGDQSATPPAKLNWSTSSPDTKAWQAFAEDPKPQPQSIRTRNGHPNKPAAQETSSWGFETESFTAASGTQRARPSFEGNTSAESNKQAGSQPAGWAGF